MENSEFQIYDYDSQQAYTIDFKDENEDEPKSANTKKVVLLIPINRNLIEANKDDPYLVRVPEPQFQSADLYILEMPSIQGEAEAASNK